MCSPGPELLWNGAAESYDCSREVYDALRGK
jgi:hypothetical protein